LYAVLFGQGLIGGLLLLIGQKLVLRLQRLEHLVFFEGNMDAGIFRFLLLVEVLLGDDPRVLVPQIVRFYFGEGYALVDHEVLGKFLAGVKNLTKVALFDSFGNAFEGSLLPDRADILLLCAEGV
jgi:hypothetical protein